MANWSVATLVSVLVSLVLEWVPALKVKWDGLTEGRKRGIMALLVAVVSVISVTGNCYWWGDVCPANWYETIWEIVLVFLAAAGVQQGVHRLLKKPDGEVA